MNDPLLGGNSLLGDFGGSINRQLMSNTLDELMGENPPENVSLLKIDLEGSGADALEGATKVLQATKHVVFEVHGEDECSRGNRLLFESGFTLRRTINRELWREKD